MPDNISYESRGLLSFTKQSMPVFYTYENSVYSENVWRELYDFTRNAYKFFSENPSLLTGECHEDDEHRDYGRNGDKTAIMRKGVKKLNSSFR